MAVCTAIFGDCDCYFIPNASLVTGLAIHPTVLIVSWSEVRNWQQRHLQNQGAVQRGIVSWALLVERTADRQGHQKHMTRRLRFQQIVARRVLEQYKQRNRAIVRMLVVDEALSEKSERLVWGEVVVAG